MRIDQPASFAPFSIRRSFILRPLPDAKPCTTGVAGKFTFLRVSGLILRRVKNFRMALLIIHVRFQK
jgi:hypothetical protein